MSKIRELMQNKEDTGYNTSVCGGGGQDKKKLSLLAEAMTPLEVYHNFMNLSLGDFALLKASAGNMIGVPHHVFDFAPNKDHDNTTRAHLADIHSPKSHHHELLDLVMTDNAEGGSFWKSLKKSAKHTFSKRNIQKAQDFGKDVYNTGRKAYDWYQSPAGQKTIEQASQLAGMAAKAAA